MSEEFQERRTPQQAAERLAASLDENTQALSRIQKRYRLVLVLVAVVALTLGAALKFNYDGNVDRCKSGNELRVDIDKKWDAIVAYLDEAGTDERPGGPEFLALLDENLEQRDCSDINLLGH